MALGDPSIYESTPLFEKMEARRDVSAILDHALITITRDSRVVHAHDEYGERWIYVSEDKRLCVEARPALDTELAREESIRAHLSKAGEWFGATSKLHVLTRRKLAYADNATHTGRITHLLSVVLFDIPFGANQTCRWVGLVGRFETTSGEHDPRGEEAFLGGMFDPNKLDEFVVTSAAKQLAMSWRAPGS